MLYSNCGPELNTFFADDISFICKWSALINSIANNDPSQLSATHATCQEIINNKPAWRTPTVMPSSWRQPMQFNFFLLGKSMSCILILGFCLFVQRIEMLVRRCRYRTALLLLMPTCNLCAVEREILHLNARFNVSVSYLNVALIHVKYRAGNLCLTTQY